jgi:hypothetical protein
VELAAEKSNCFPTSLQELFFWLEMVREKSGGISSPDVLRPHIPFFLSQNGFLKGQYCSANCPIRDDLDKNA